MGVIKMTLDDSVARNPYNEEIGDVSAYIRYIRYTVDGMYDKSSKEVRAILIEKGIIKEKK